MQQASRELLTMCPFQVIPTYSKHLHFLYLLSAWLRNEAWQD